MMARSHGQGLGLSGLQRRLGRRLQSDGPTRHGVMRARLALALVGVLTGAASSASAASSPTLPRDGLLVFGDQGALFTIEPDGTGLRALGELGAYEPRWSPNGARIAYSDEDGRLWLVSADGSRARRLTRPSRVAKDSSPAWSPRGDWLVHARVPSSGSGTRSGLRTIRIDGTGGRWLSSESVSLGAPDWSRDGKRITGQRGTGARGRLWVVSADGSDPRRLGPKGLVGEQPRWSPDGRRVAFVDVEAGVVRVLDLRTNRVRTVFEPEPETYDVEYVGWAHAWSPDGRWLAVQWTNAVECVDDPTTLWCERAEIWVVSATDTRQRLIHAGPFLSYGNGLDWRWEQ